LAAETGLAASTGAQVDSQIQAFSNSLSGEGSEAFTDSEHKHHKTHKRHNKKAAKKHHKKHHQKSVESLVRVAEVAVAVPEKKVEVKVSVAQKAAPKPAPVSKSLVGSKATNQDAFDKFSQAVDVPIDEIKAITLKVSPTYNLDQVESVTLKSFRKVVGYDTFNSILKGDRNEKKDISDHYNVTVSMMVRRIPAEVAAAPPRDPFNGGKTLSESLDKGFPYDDGDSSPDNMTPTWKLKNH